LCRPARERLRRARATRATVRGGLISVDTLRADRLGAYGYAKPTSPRLDAFARDAVRFSQAFAHSSETRFSVASLLSGFHPHETGVTDTAMLPEEVETLAEILRGHGFATAAVVSNYVLRGRRGWRQGFDVRRRDEPAGDVAQVAE
jgi:arylsulfatase A-like enzyme